MATRRWTLGLTLLAGIVTVGLGVVLRHSISASTVASTSQLAMNCREWASAGRLATIAILFVGWPTLVRLGTRFNVRTIAQAQQYRWRVTAWLFVLELTIGQNLLGRVLG